MPDVTWKIDMGSNNQNSGGRRPVFYKKLDTPPKTNMEPEKSPLEKEKHLQTTNFQVPC